MKKLIFTVATLVGFTALGQDITNKNGYTVLPEEGDYMLGFDAVPVLNFGLNAVNLMTDTGDGAQHPGTAYETQGTNAMIVGKYFLSNDMAIRGRFAVNTSRTTGKFYGNNPLTPTAAGNGTAENILLRTQVAAEQEYALAGGLEWRRGHNRLQGFYGGEAMIAMGNSRTVNTYEIEYNKVAQDSSFISTAPGSSQRLLSDKSGTAISLGMRGFVGVEYFILPKISIGAEAGFGLHFTTAPRGTEVIEHWGIEPGDNTSNDNYRYTEENQVNNTSANSGSRTDLGNPFGMGTAALTINFHF